MALFRKKNAAGVLRNEWTLTWRKGGGDSVNEVEYCQINWAESGKEQCCVENTTSLGDRVG